MASRLSMTTTSTTFSSTRTSSSRTHSISFVVHDGLVVYSEFSLVRLLARRRRVPKAPSRSRSRASRTRSLSSRRTSTSGRRMLSRLKSTSNNASTSTLRFVLSLFLLIHCHFQISIFLNCENKVALFPHSPIRIVVCNINSHFHIFVGP